MNDKMVVVQQSDVSPLKHCRVQYRDAACTHGSAASRTAAHLQLEAHTGEGRLIIHLLDSHS